MPTYDYECDACAHKFEQFQGINDSVLTKCPECKKKKLRRLFGTGGAIVFKGSGFYQTDYRSENYKKGASADKSAGESKSSESRSGESQSGESKSSESKSSESKSSESKPASPSGSDSPKKSSSEGKSKPKSE